MSIVYTLTDNSVTILGDDFVPKTMPSTHPAFADVVAAVKAGDGQAVKRLMDLPNAIASFMQGKIQITERQLFYDGKPLNNSLTTRILQFMQEGDKELATPLINFLEKVRENPSRRAAEGLYDWAVRSKLPITPDGDILAWKIVRGDYLDYHSSSFDNSIGNVVEVPRNAVDEDPDQTCSHGLHFCSTEYLPHYYQGDSSRRILVVKIHPKDVVAFPRDYNVSKGRACRYEVIGEVPAEKAKDFFPSVVSYTSFDNDNDDNEPLDLELEVGRYYRNRDGDVVQIIADSEDPFEDYPFTGDDDRSYTRFGAYYDGEEHYLDLVELLPEDFDPDLEEPAAEKPKSFIQSFIDSIFG